MRTSMRSFLALAAVATLVTVATAANKQTDYFNRQFASFNVRTVALMPVVVLPSVNGAADMMGQSLEKSLAPVGYHWVSVPALRAALVAAKQPGLVDAVNEGIRKGVPPDTTALRSLGQIGVADAVLTSVISTWERETIDVTMAGQSMTQIAMTSYLYSTKTGELLWSHKFQVKGEGPYNNPDGSEVVGVKSGGLESNQMRTSTSLDPPTYEEIAVKLAGQVRDSLPPPAKPAAP
ncbi:MAG TPA: hypothetical protein VKF80_06825 [Candidatus Eisenbacteria bacterium]|nr:hypothetical protein [Candidatus Eisenbacteria bacterium]